jgi:hypothetical protein
MWSRVAAISGGIAHRQRDHSGQRGLQREVDLIHHDVLTKQLACTTLERGMAENEVQCFLATAPASGSSAEGRALLNSR